MKEERQGSEALAEKLSDPATVTALNSVVDRMTELHESGVMESFFQTMQAISLMRNAMTDSMVNNNASMACELAEIGVEAAGPELLDALREMKQLSRSGNLKILVQAADVLALMSNAINDSMVQKMASMVSALAEDITSPHTANILKSTIKGVSKTVQHHAAHPPKPGILNLLSAMRDPEVQAGLMFMTTLAKNMHQCMIQTYTGAEDTNKK